MCIELKEKHNIHQKVKPIVTLRNTFLALPLVCSALMKNSVSLEMVLCKSMCQLILLMIMKQTYSFSQNSWI